VKGNSSSIVPTAPGVTFTRCTLCEANSDSGTRTGDIYYAFSAVSTATVTFTATGSGLGTEAIFEVHGTTTLDTGAQVGTTYSSTTTVTASFTTSSANTLVLGGSLDLPNTPTYSGEANPWTIDETVGGYDYYVHTTQAAAGAGALTATYTAGYARPTITVAVFR
jgi:hypothetical protein